MLLRNKLSNLEGMAQACRASPTTWCVHGDAPTNEAESKSQKAEKSREIRQLSRSHSAQDRHPAGLLFTALLA